MDNMGRILPLDEVYKLPEQEQKKFREIPEEELPELEGMNRHERRAWYARNKKRLKRIK